VLEGERRGRENTDPPCRSAAIPLRPKGMARARFPSVFQSIDALLREAVIAPATARRFKARHQERRENRFHDIAGISNQANGFVRLFHCGKNKLISLFT
jgi:hypothetical protein